MDEFTATASAPLTNSIGLHARPSVKLTKLAKTFASQIEVAPGEDGPWVDAKSTKGTVRSSLPTRDNPDEFGNKVKIYARTRLDDIVIHRAAV